MKQWLTIPLLFFCAFLKAQNWDAVDTYVQTISAPTPDSLARKLTAPYAAQAQKVRAIYSWITQNIRYTSALYPASKRGKGYQPPFDPTDTMSVWKSGDEMTAIRVMHRKFTVCEGYAKLFKVLCDHAGINAKVIYGYVRTNAGSQRFRSNHAWNAVLIDSTWQLLDVTWATGYFTYQDEFVQQRNDFYYLTSPKEFIRDHYPEDLRWALLTELPAYNELNKAPLVCRAMGKYNIPINQLGSGVVEAYAGDTVRLKLVTTDITKDKAISPDAYFDSTMLATSPATLFLLPELAGNVIHYSFVVPAEPIQWLHLMYNGDVILRYHLKVKAKEAVAMKQE